MTNFDYQKIFLIVILIIIFLWLAYYFMKIIKQIYFWYWVPFVPSSDYKIDELVENMKLKKWQKFLDIWCWDWRILEKVKIKYPDNIVNWIENSPDIYKLAIKKKKINNLDYKIIKWDFFKEIFSDYDVIFTFMTPYLMKKIWKKIKNECKDWTLFYSNAYEIKWEKIFKTIKIEKWKYCSYLYIYKV